MATIAPIPPRKLPLRGTIEIIRGTNSLDVEFEGTVDTLEGYAELELAPAAHACICWVKEPNEQYAAGQTIQLTPDEIRECQDELMRMADAWKPEPEEP